MKKLIIISIISFFSLTLFAQEDSVEFKPKTKHFVGFHAGAVSGLGFSYRYWPSKFGIQVTGIPVFAQGFNFTSIGVTGLYTLKDNKKVDLYGYLGNHLLLLDGQVVNNTGFGLGFKIDILEDMDFSFQAGYGVYDITNSPFSGFTGGLGLYYHL